MIKLITDNKRRLLLLILSVLLIIFTAVAGVTVAADDFTFGNSGYINLKNYCVEGKSDASSDKAGAYRYKRLNGDYAELRMMYLSESNSGVSLKTDSGDPLWAYCIEFGKDINSVNRRTAKTLEASAYWNSLSEDMRAAINLTVLYGFPSDDLGVSAADAYAATQAVIWEFQTGIRTLNGGNRRSSVTYNNKFLVSTTFSSMLEDGLREKAGKSAYNMLLEKIYSHSVVPDFETEIATLDFDEEINKYILRLEDKNGVLQKYNVTSSSSDLKIATDENQLILESGNVFSNAKLTFSKKLPTSYGQSALVLESDGIGQVTYIGVKPSEVTAELSVTVNKKPEPETTVPETTVPRTTAPETTVPETTLPETTAPKTTTQPETTRPELTTQPVVTTEVSTVLITDETPLFETPADTSDGNSLFLGCVLMFASVTGLTVLNKSRKY